MITFQNLSLDPFYNQAFEEVIFETVFDDDVFLLWRNHPAVVVGCYQNICREVNINALQKEQIPVIRRMTGGGTVYHDLGNVNYTLILQNQSGIDYDLCLSPVIDALNSIGIPARKNRTCDIAIGDGKISGSAQRIARGRLLHHGTLLFQSDLSRLDQITTHHKNDHFKTKGTLSDICTVTNISEHIEHQWSVEQFMEQLLFQVIPDQDHFRSLTKEQEEMVLQLKKEKYESWKWTWGKTPPFTYEKEGTFHGDPIHISYQAKRGILSDVKIISPSIDEEKVAELFLQARLDPKELDCICQKIAGEHKDELLNLLI